MNNLNVLHYIYEYGVINYNKHTQLLCNIMQNTELISLLIQNTK
jgi:hypothetical protein